MVVRAGERVALARPQAQRRVVAGMEDARGVDGPAEAIVDEQVGIPLAVGLEAVGEVGDPQGPLGRGDARIPDDAVAHGGWRIVVDRAEVALAVDELVAHRELLRQTREGVVDRRVAVGVVVAHDVADDRRALAVGPRRREAVLGHREQHAAVNRLEAVADVGQRATDDDRHRVVEVRRAHLVFERARLDVASGERVDRCHRLHVEVGDETGVVLDELRRGSTMSPMSVEKMRSAWAASSIDTCASVRVAGSIVVSRSCAAFISPRPLKRCSVMPFCETVMTASRSASNDGASAVVSPSFTVNGARPASSMSWPCTRVNWR